MFHCPYLPWPDSGNAGNAFKIVEIAIILTVKNYRLCQGGSDSGKRLPVNNGHGIRIEGDTQQDRFSSRHSFHCNYSKIAISNPIYDGITIVETAIFVFQDR